MKLLNVILSPSTTHWRFVKPVHPYVIASPSGSVADTVISIDSSSLNVIYESMAVG